MPKVATMPFKYGDRVVHYFKMPIADYSAGGKLWFAAKPSPDNDTTDGAAVIDKSFTDSVVTTDATWATWTLEFLPADLQNISFASGEDELDYEGEFQFVDASGHPKSYPDDNNYIEVKVYADIKRATA